MRAAGVLLAVIIALTGCDPYPFGAVSPSLLPPSSTTPAAHPAFSPPPPRHAASNPGLQPPAGALQYRSTLVREAQAVFGPGAPVPVLAAQINQESGWRADVTAWDNGRGLAQFMDATAATVARQYPELGAPDPYNPRWAIRAMVRYDEWLLARVRGRDPCNKWGAALKSYNGGLGYTQRAQRASSQPEVWWGATEFVPSGQSPQNFEYSRTYPRKILFTHQPHYAAWGEVACAGMTP